MALDAGGTALLVSPEVPPVHAEQLVVVDTTGQRLVPIGNVDHRFVAHVDLEQLLRRATVV
jgi:hypothetical protein